MKALLREMSEPAHWMIEPCKRPSSSISPRAFATFVAAARAASRAPGSACLVGRADRHQVGRLEMREQPEELVEIERLRRAR